MDSSEARDQCPVCKGKAERSNQAYGSVPYQLIDCERCGSFEVVRSCLRPLAEIEDSHLLSGVLRDFSERGEALRISPDSIHGIWSLLPTTLLARAMRLLHGIARKSTYFGDSVKLVYERDLALGYCKNDHEMMSMIDHLVEKGLLWQAGHASGREGMSNICHLTAPGWEAIEADRAANSESNKAFVAMWYDPGLNEAYRVGIKPAIEEDAGYKSIGRDSPPAMLHLGDIAGFVPAPPGTPGTPPTGR